jgi:hypothetical protein
MGAPYPETVTKSYTNTYTVSGNQSEEAIKEQIKSRIINTLSALSEDSFSPSIGNFAKVLFKPDGGYALRVGLVNQPSNIPSTLLGRVSSSFGGTIGFYKSIIKLKQDLRYRITFVPYRSDSEFILMYNQATFEDYSGTKDQRIVIDPPNQRGVKIFSLVNFTNAATRKAFGKAPARTLVKTKFVERVYDPNQCSNFFTICGDDTLYSTRTITNAYSGDYVADTSDQASDSHVEYTYQETTVTTEVACQPSTRLFTVPYVKTQSSSGNFRGDDGCNSGSTTLSTFTIIGNQSLEAVDFSYYNTCGENFSLSYTRPFFRDPYYNGFWACNGTFTRSVSDGVISTVETSTVSGNGSSSSSASSVRTTIEDRNDGDAVNYSVRNDYVTTTVVYSGQIDENIKNQTEIMREIKEEFKKYRP